MKFRALVLLITGVACSPARADWAYTRWGMTPEQVAALSSGAVKVLPKVERTDMGDHSEMAARGTFKDGSRVLDVGFVFDGKGGLALQLHS